MEDFLKYSIHNKPFKIGKNFLGKSEILFHDNVYLTVPTILKK